MLKRLYGTAAVLMQLAIPSHANAAPYYLMFGVSNETRVRFYDAGSIIKDDSRIKFWIKIRTNELLVPKLPYEAMMRIEIDCKEMTWQQFAVTTYDRAGTVTFDSNVKGRVDQIVPDTDGAEIMTVACDPGFPLNVPATAKVDDVTVAAKRVFALLKDRPASSK